MLKDIMNLAGIKPVSDLPAFAPHPEIELEPAHAAEPADDMADMISKLVDDGHKVTQQSNDRALVNNAVWITVHGVTYPV